MSNRRKSNRSMKWGVESNSLSTVDVRVLNKVLSGHFHQVLEGEKRETVVAGRGHAGRNWSKPEWNERHWLRFRHCERVAACSEARLQSDCASLPTFLEGFIKCQGLRNCYHY